MKTSIILKLHFKVSDKKCPKCHITNLVYRPNGSLVCPECTIMDELNKEYVGKKEISFSELPCNDKYRLAVIHIDGYDKTDGTVVANSQPGHPIKDKDRMLKEVIEILKEKGIEDIARKNEAD